jgi:hypothetical protein
MMTVPGTLQKAEIISDNNDAAKRYKKQKSFRTRMTLQKKRSTGQYIMQAQP